LQILRTKLLQTLKAARKHRKTKWLGIATWIKVKACHCKFSATLSKDSEYESVRSRATEFKIHCQCVASVSVFIHLWAFVQFARGFEEHSLKVFLDTSTFLFPVSILVPLLQPTRFLMTSRTARSAAKLDKVKAQLDEFLVAGKYYEVALCIGSECFKFNPFRPLNCTAQCKRGEFGVFLPYFWSSTHSDWQRAKRTTKPRHWSWPGSRNWWTTNRSRQPQTSLCSSSTRLSNRKRRSQTSTFVRFLIHSISNLILAWQKQFRSLRICFPKPLKTRNWLCCAPHWSEFAFLHSSEFFPILSSTIFTVSFLTDFPWSDGLSRVISRKATHNYTENWRAVTGGARWLHAQNIFSSSSNIHSFLWLIHGSCLFVICPGFCWRLSALLDCWSAVRTRTCTKRMGKNS